MARITKAHHTGFTVASLERSLAFYRDLLGFEVVFQWNPRAPYIGELRRLSGCRPARRDPAHSQLRRVSRAARISRHPARNRWTWRTAISATRHIAFNVDELEPLYERLKASGVRTVSAPMTPTIGPNTRRPRRLRDRSRRLSRRADRDAARLRRLSSPMQDACGGNGANVERGARQIAMSSTPERRRTAASDDPRRGRARRRRCEPRVARARTTIRRRAPRPATRERIQEAARTLGYQPNVAARGLRMARTWTLGLLLPNFTNPMSTRASPARRNSGRASAATASSSEPMSRARRRRRSRACCSRRRVDGLLAASGVLGDGFLRRFASAGNGPVVMLNRRVRGVRPSVTVDDAAGTALADRASRRSRARRDRRDLRQEPDRHHPPPPRRLPGGGKAHRSPAGR